MTQRHTELCLCWCVTLTNGKELDASVPQALSRRDDIVLGFSIRDEDSNLGHSGPRARFRLETVLQDEIQSQT